MTQPTLSEYIRDLKTAVYIKSVPPTAVFRHNLGLQTTVCGLNSSEGLSWVLFGVQVVTRHVAYGVTYTTEKNSF